MVIIFKDEACKAHITGPGHPEQPARFDAVDEAIQRVKENTKRLKLGEFKPIDEDISIKHMEKHTSLR